jgi:hypothetical protein
MPTSWWRGSRWRNSRKPGGDVFDAIYSKLLGDVPERLAHIQIAQSGNYRLLQQVVEQQAHAAEQQARVIAQHDRLIELMGSVIGLMEEQNMVLHALIGRQP